MHARIKTTRTIAAPLHGNSKVETLVLRRSRARRAPNTARDSLAIARSISGNCQSVTKASPRGPPADFKSVRGKFRFNANHIPIQNFYLQEAVKDADGNFVLKTVATIVEDNQDRFVTQCQMK